MRKSSSALHVDLQFLFFYFAFAFAFCCSFFVSLSVDVTGEGAVRFAFVLRFSTARSA